MKMQHRQEFNRSLFIEETDRQALWPIARRVQNIQTEELQQFGMLLDTEDFAKTLLSTMERLNYLLDAHLISHEDYDLMMIPCVGLMRKVTN